MSAVQSRGLTLWIGDNPAINYARDLLALEIQQGDYTDRNPPIIGVMSVLEKVLIRNMKIEDLTSTIREYKSILDSLDGDWNSVLTDSTFVDTVRQSNWSVFNSLAWEKRDSEDNV